ncbi:MAG: insulinase family protein, partial [bacterium]|nr:insulinase family protein [bacterium]
MAKKISCYKDLGCSGAYEMMYEEYISDIKTAGIVLRHKKSGARVCVLSNDDENKVFCAGFRTTSTDSTGVPHIIEHTVLNGSKNFPSRDPFMQLAKGSLNTFLNAMTWPDKTLYPVASCNDKDFSNLMHVYLDAVFFPNIYKKREIFMQEGWHYEMETPEDELKISGVVYSEMKGAVSSPDRMIYDELFSALLPDTTYGVNSGGDPDVIPTLTYEDYLDFHRRYYHPSNSYIFLYGNMDMDERLDFLDREYLSQFDAITPDSEVVRQAHFGKNEPVRKTVSYPVGSEEDTDGRAYLAYASLAGPSLNSLECRAYSVLSNVLIDSDSAPVKNALIDSGIGDEIYGGFEDAVDEVFTVVAKNADEKDADKFYGIVTDTLRMEVDKGINEKAILACLNRMEFEFREATGGGYPLGLLHVMSIMQSWLYDDSAAFSYMHVLDDIAELKARIGTGYYEELVKKYILESDHALLLTMVPEKGLLEKKENALKEKLAAYKASLTEEEIAAVVRSTHALREYQSAPQTEEEKNCIPTLEREDIPREGVPYSNEERVIGGCRGLYHAVDTNGITYLTLSFEIGKMPLEYVPYVGLLADVLCGVDTDRHTFSDIDIEIKLNTGDVEIVPWTYRRKDGSFLPVFHAKVSVMPENIAYALDMLAEVMTSTRFTDKKRITALLAEIKSIKQREIMSSGHSYASARAVSYFDAEECYRQAYGGLDYYFFIKDLYENIDAKFNECAESLRKVAAFIFDPSKLLISIGCDEKGYVEVEKLLPGFTAAIDKIPHEPLGEGEDFVPRKKNEGIMIPSQVQYVARAGSYEAAGYDFNGAYNVVKTAVNVDYLYQQVRVRGGAYGCGCRFGTENGKLIFWSYRDPNLKKTDDVFAATGEFIRTHEFDDGELTKYIIG